MPADKSSNAIFAIVLAAGSASRFGATKQLAKFDGEPLARHAVNVANAVFGSNTVLVVGHAWQAVAASCSPLQGFLIVNEHYAAGIGGSLATAVKAVAHTASAVVIVLADQVLVSPEHLQALCAGWSGADNEIVASAYAGSAGAPLLFPRACFNDLQTLGGDTGGRALLSDDRFSVRKIVFEAAAIDIDTEADLTQISRSARS